MSAHVLLNLLSKLRKKDKMQGLPRIGETLGATRKMHFNL